MDSNLLTEFKILTKNLLDSKERRLLQKIISYYKEDEDFFTFLEALKKIVLSPERCQLLPFIKLFLLKKHRHLGNRLCEEEFKAEFSCSSVRRNSFHNTVCSQSSMTVKKDSNLSSALIIRKMNESLGIGIRGGIEFGCGIFVSDIQPDSPACKSGLRLGDQILYANNVSFDSITANAAARFLASAFPLPNNGNISRLRIVYSRTGMVPAHRTNRERMAWFDVKSGATVFGPFNLNEESQLTHYAPSSPYTLGLDGYLEKSVDIHSTFSFAIRGGHDFGLGIHVSAIGNKDPEGTVANIDFRAGDEIIAVNGKELRLLRHTQAVSYLRKQRHLRLTVRQCGKYPLYKEISSEVTWIAADPNPDGTTSTSTTKSTRTEIPWETVVTVRRNNRSSPLHASLGQYSGQVAQNSNQSLSFSLTKSSSGSLIVDAVKTQQNPPQFTTTQQSAAIVCDPYLQRPRDCSALHSSRRRCSNPQRTPISTVQFDEMSKVTSCFDRSSGIHSAMSDQKNIFPFQYDNFVSGSSKLSRLPGVPSCHKPSYFEPAITNGNRINNKQMYSLVTCSDEFRKQQNISPGLPKKFSTVRGSFRNDGETKANGYQRYLSDEEKFAHEAFETESMACDYDDADGAEEYKNVTIQTNASYTTNIRRPSVAVKGKHTTLIKLTKRADTSLGLGISGGDDSADHCLRIDHALPDSIAGEAVAEGLLQPGCLLLAVDNQSLVGVKHEDAVSLIRHCFRDSAKPTLNLLVSASDLVDG